MKRCAPTVFESVASAQSRVQQEKHSPSQELPPTLLDMDSMEMEREVEVEVDGQRMYVSMAELEAEVARQLSSSAEPTAVGEPGEKCKAEASPPCPKTSKAFHCDNGQMSEKTGKKTSDDHRGFVGNAGGSIATSLEEGLAFTDYYLDQLEKIPSDQLPDGYTDALQLLADRMDNCDDTDSTSFSGIEAPHCSKRMLHYKLEQRLGRSIRKPTLVHAIEWDKDCQKELLKMLDDEGDKDCCVFGDITGFFRDELLEEGGLISELKKNPSIAVETLAPLMETGRLMKRHSWCIRHRSLDIHQLLTCCSRIALIPKCLKIKGSFGLGTC